MKNNGKVKTFVFECWSNRSLRDKAVYKSDIELNTRGGFNLYNVSASDHKISLFGYDKADITINPDVWLRTRNWQRIVSY